MKTYTTAHRWALVNRNTLNVRGSKATRVLARNAKRPNERIFDTERAVFVR